MTVNTQPNASLVVSIDGDDYACQVISAEFSPPGIGTSTVTETACPDGVVSEPGAIAAGKLSGEVFTDTTDTGITWVLGGAFETNAELDFIYTQFPELGPTKAVQWTGTCRVATFTQPFAKPGLGKHPLDLEILTATRGRPAAAA